MRDNQKLLNEARERFKQIETAESEQREQSLLDQKMENGQQWDENDLKTRKGRPSLTINKEAGVVKQILGDQRQNRPQIKVRPVDSQSDPKMAELLNGLIRNIENVSDAESAYDNGGACAVIGGYGYWRVITDYADDMAFEQDILIKRVPNPFSVYYDQSGTEPDYSDANYCFITEVMDKDAFESKYPNHGAVSVEGGQGEDLSGWFTEEEVRIAEYWWKEPATKHIFEMLDGRVIEIENAETMEAQIPNPQTGQPMLVNIVQGDGLDQPTPYKRDRKVACHKIMWLTMSGTEVIDGPNKWSGKYIPIIPCLGEEVWINGKRILRGALRHAHDSQKLYNWARSNSVEALSWSPKQPYLLTPEQIKGHEAQWNQAYVKPMPYLLYNQTGQIVPQRLTGSIADSGCLQEAIQASDDIKSTTGIYDASLGARGNETSGKAIMARQREGDVATFIFSDNQAKAIMHTGRVLVDLIPKIYDTDRVIRLMGEDGKEGWERINQVVGINPDGSKRIKNDLSIGRYDVVVDAGPGYMTRRMEAAEGMIQIMQSAPQLVPFLIPKIAKNLDWPGASDLAEELNQFIQASTQQPPDPMQGIELEGKQLDNEKKKVDIAKELAPSYGTAN